MFEKSIQQVFVTHVFMIERVKRGCNVSYSLETIRKEVYRFFEFGFYTETEKGILYNMIDVPSFNAYNVYSQLLDTLDYIWFMESGFLATWEKESDKFITEMGYSFDDEYDFREHQSTARDMTREEREEWADKFFDD